MCGPEESLAGVNDDFAFFPIRSTMLMSLNICQLVLIHRPLEARPCSVADREKMVIDALSLLVRRSARSEGTEWISEEGVAAGPPREPSVDIYGHPFPDLWRKHLYPGLL